MAIRTGATVSTVGGIGWEIVIFILFVLMLAGLYWKKLEAFRTVSENSKTR